MSSSRVLCSRRTLVVIAVTAFTVGFAWLWWQGVPTLYQTAGAGPEAENARLGADATTRVGLLAGLVGLGALGTFWLNSRVHRIAGVGEAWAWLDNRAATELCAEAPADRRGALDMADVVRTPH